MCGGRDFSDAARLAYALEILHMHRTIAELIHGAAPGADMLADEWGRWRGIKVTPVEAEWDRLKKAAGPIRNQRMLDMKPDGVVAFPGGSGTADMVRRARKAGVPVWEPYKGYKNMAEEKR